MIVLLLPMIAALGWGIYHDRKYEDPEPLIKVGYGFIIIIGLLFVQVAANTL